jgi:hypothetical protein
LVVVGLSLFAFVACYRNADDDDDSATTDDDTATDDDTTADDDSATPPPIPHGPENGTNCLGCHRTQPGYPHDDTYTNDDCLNCHHYQ